VQINAKFEQELIELELKNAKLKKSISEYNETDISKWEKFKTNFNTELNEIGKAITRMTENK